MKTVELLENPEIVHQVFQAVDGEGYLPVDTPVVLEMLSDDDDGIFPSARSWYSFLSKNFGTGTSEGGIWLTGDEVKESTLKKWCAEQSTYLDKFVTPIGGGQFVRVNPEHLELSFSYDANNYSSNPARNHENGYPNTVEIYVTATVRQA
ncbi:hypothetical protein [Vibrio phage V-YDF132]|nr:hypothetical protein [Vibrio phage V-YDF132]